MTRRAKASRKIGTSEAAAAEARRVREFAERAGILTEPATANLSVLTTRGPLAAKRAHADGIAGYDRARTFRVAPVCVESVAQLAELLAELECAPHTLLLAEPPRSDTALDRTERRGENFATERGRDWLFVDVDGAELPTGTDALDPAAVLEALPGMLPAELQGVDGVLTFTTKAGLPEADGKLRARLAFLLDRPLSAARLRTWANTRHREASQGEMRPDSALYSRVQAHYTAAPIFEDGRSDPFAGRTRVHRIPGKRATVAADEIKHIAAMPADPPPALEADDAADSRQSVPRGDALEYIGDDGLGLHEAIRRAVWQRARRWGGRASDRNLKKLARESRRLALHAAETGRLPGRSREYIKAETGADAIRRSFDGAVRRGAGLRIPPATRSNLTDAERKLRRVAAGRVKPANGYSLDDYALAVAHAGRARLGVEYTADELAERIDSLARRPVHPAIRTQLRDFSARTAEDYRTAHRLTGAPAGVQVGQIDSLADVRVEPGVISAVRAPHGTGKTKLLAAPLMRERFDVVYLVHRRSLARSTAWRFGLAHYRDHEAIDAANVTGAPIAAVVNSAPREPLKPATDHPGAVIIDEAEQVLRHVVGDAVPDNEKSAVHQRVGELVAEPGAPVLVMDAGLDDLTVSRFAAMAPDKPVRIFDLAQPRSGTVRVLRAGGHGRSAESGRGAPAALAAEVAAKVAAGQRVVVATDRKAFAKTLDARLRRQTGKVGGLITADSPDAERAEFDDDPDGLPERMGWRWLIYSPAIAAGVSIESDHFDAVAGLYSGVVSPADFAQMLFRVRRVNAWTVAVACSAQGKKPSAAERRASLTALDRHQHGDDDRELDDLSDLAAGTHAREDDDLAWFGPKLITALADHGLTIEHVEPGADTSAAGEALNNLAAELKEAEVEALVAARVLTHSEAKAMRSRDDLDTDELLALRRHKVTTALGLEEPETLEPEDVRLAERLGGRIGRIIQQFDATRRSSFDWREGDADQPAVTRRFLADCRDLLRDFLVALGVDPLEGTGTWGRARAQQALRAVAQHPATATEMKLASVTKNTTRPQRGVDAVLKRLGLVAEDIGSRRKRRWRIEPDRWALVLSLAARRAGRGHGEPQPQTTSETIGDRGFQGWDAGVKFSGASVPAWLIRHFRDRSCVYLLEPKWIMENTGVSRATAYRRLEGARTLSANLPTTWWRVHFKHSGRDATGAEPASAVSYLQDTDAVRQEIERVSGAAVAEVERLYAEPPDREAAAPTDQQDAANLPADDGEPPLAFAELLDRAGLSSAKTRRAVAKGEKHLRRHEAAGTLPNPLTKLADATDSDHRKLAALSLGMAQGSPAAALRWIADNLVSRQQEERA